MAMSVAYKREYTSVESFTKVLPTPVAVGYGWKLTSITAHCTTDARGASTYSWDAKALGILNEPQLIAHDNSFFSACDFSVVEEFFQELGWPFPR